jgi:AraC-like DNA-binding protein
LGFVVLIKLDYAAPPPELAEFVSAFYLFETDEDQFDEVERADIAQFRISTTGTGRVVFADGRDFIIPPAALYGPRSMSSRIVAKGPIKVFGAGLWPAGWAALTGLEADKLANTVVDATDALGPGVIEVAGAIAAAPDIEAMVKIGSLFAKSLWDRAREVPLWFTRAVDAWLATETTPDMDVLIAQTGLSRRQIEKLMKRLYGASPKLLVRKYRALRTAHAVATGKGSWQDFAADAYYDQSHCIREVKEFTGITPRAIQAETSRLMHLTYERSRIKPLIRKLGEQ